MFIFPGTQQWILLQMLQSQRGMETYANTYAYIFSHIQRYSSVFRHSNTYPYIFTHFQVYSYMFIHMHAYGGSAHIDSYIFIHGHICSNTLICAHICSYYICSYIPRCAHICFGTLIYAHIGSCKLKYANIPSDMVIYAHRADTSSCISSYRFILDHINAYRLI